MRLALDTNRYRDYCANTPEAVNAVRRAEEVLLPFVTIAELRAGFLCGNLARRNEAVLDRFLSGERVGVLFPDEATTRHYAALYRQLREQGTPIPVNDIWIASLVVQHHLWLLSRDAHFDALPQLLRA